MVNNYNETEQTASPTSAATNSAASDELNKSFVDISKHAVDPNDVSDKTNGLNGFVNKGEDSQNGGDELTLHESSIYTNKHTFGFFEDIALPPLGSSSNGLEGGTESNSEYFQLKPVNSDDSQYLPKFVDFLNEHNGDSGGDNGGNSPTLAVSNFNTNDGFYELDEANKLQPSDNEVEIDENSNEGDFKIGVDVHFGDALYNDSTDTSIPPVEMIDLDFRKIRKGLKVDCSDHEDFLLLFIYINNIQLNTYYFQDRLFAFEFTTDDVNFCKFHQFVDNENSIVTYRLTVPLRHEIQPNYSSITCTSKKIEIKFIKSERAHWGSMADICEESEDDNESNSPGLKLDLADLNKWNPVVPQPPTSQAVVLFDDKQNMSDDEHNSQWKICRREMLGYTGLTNIGNTCFLNSVIQCLVNTDELKNYFLADMHMVDINPTNPIGHGGIIAKAFAQLMEAVWSGNYSSFTPSKLKHIIGEKVSSTFLGFGQHDAQEFMSFLLDAIHEDLNRIQDKPKPKPGGNDDDSDEDLSIFDEVETVSEAKLAERRKWLLARSNQLWKQYKLFNDSIIIDLFCGQFKSILTCPDCHKKSITFDPFLFVPLPIPTKYSYEVIYFARDPETGMCKGAYKYTLSFFHNATVSDLCEAIAKRTNAPVNNMRVLQPQEGDILPKILNPKWLLLDYNLHTSFSSILRPLMLFESLKDDDEYVELCIVQRVLNDFLGPNIIGHPFLVCLKRSMLTYSYLATVLCSFAAYSVSAEQFSLRQQSQANFDLPLSARQASFSLSQYMNLFETGGDDDDDDNNNNNNSKYNVSLIRTRDSERPLPNLLYYKCTPQTMHDYIAPFILRKATHSTLEEFDEDDQGHEIVPPTVSPQTSSGGGAPVAKAKFPQTLNVNQLEKETSASTLKAAVMAADEKMANDSDDEEEVVVPVDEQDKEKAMADDDDAEKMETEDGTEKSVEYNSHAAIKLEPAFYITMDWINSRKFPAHVCVNVNRSMNKIVNIPAPISEEREVSLENCLHAFNEPEVLGPQNCWRCPKCKCLREATKQLSFWRLPSNLVIQLKRFRMRSALSRDKLHTYVRYPLRGLDLEPYQSAYGMIDSNGRKVRPVYDLYAVVNHFGSAFGGHYTAFARDKANVYGWRNFDDSSVDKIEEDIVVNPNAYLLFYRQRDTSQSLREHNGS